MILEKAYAKFKKKLNQKYGDCIEHNQFYKNLP